MTTKKEQHGENIGAIAELNKNMEVVISLLLRMIPKDKSGISLKEQVKILSNRDIRPRDIAQILGRTQSHITKELAGLHKKKGKKHEKEE